MSAEEWLKVSRLLDYVLKQPSGGAQGVAGIPEKPKKPRKKRPEKEKPDSPMKQETMF